MALHLDVRLVSADRLVWRGQASSVVAKTVEGEIGILPRHEPMLALLADGEVRITLTDGESLSVAVHGGFFSVGGNEVAILAQAAELAEDIDVDRAIIARDRAAGLAAEDEEAAAALRRAELRLALSTSKAGHAG